MHRLPNSILPRYFVNLARDAAERLEEKKKKKEKRKNIPADPIKQKKMREKLWKSDS